MMWLAGRGFPKQRVHFYEEKIMFFEPLESRALLSASAVNATILADRLQIQNDLIQFKSDCIEYTNTLIADCAALQADDLKQDATLAPLFKTLHTDVANMQTQLKADNLAECSAVLKDQSVIVNEEEQILTDKGNPTKLKADKAALLTDRIQLQTDEITGLNTRLATRQADYTKLFADLSAITTAIGSDSGASAKLKADVTKFTDDRTDALNTIEGDIQKLITDRTKLVTDLTALQNQS
jgi:hypothetical protein